MPSNSLIGNLAVTLGLNTAAFEAGATKAEARANTLRGRMAKIGDSMKGFAGGLVVGIGVAAIGALAKNAFDMAAALDESAQKVGLTVEALQELNMAATQSGISEEQLATGIERMNKSVGQLAQGAKPAVDAFAKIGLSFDDLKGKTPEVQLGIIADKLNQLPDVQQRVAIGSQIMGKSFSELLPLINLGSKGLEDYAQKQRAQGEITTEEAKQLDSLSDTWDRLKVRIGVAAAKIIAMFAELAGKLDESVLSWYKWRDGTIGAAEQMATGAINAVRNMVTEIANWVGAKLNAVWDSVKAKIDTVKTAFHGMYDAVVGHSYVPDMVKGIGESIAQLQQLMVDPSLSATQKVGAAFQSLAGLVGSLFGQKAGGLLSSIGGLVSALAPCSAGAGSANPSFRWSAVSIRLHPCPSWRTAAAACLEAWAASTRTCSVSTAHPLRAFPKASRGRLVPTMLRWPEC
jgi:phage-related protein